MFSSSNQSYQQYQIRQPTAMMPPQPMCAPSMSFSMSPEIPCSVPRPYQNVWPPSQSNAEKLSDLKEREKFNEEKMMMMMKIQKMEEEIVEKQRF